MLLQVNQDALEARIEKEVETAIQKISDNAKNGIAKTEITFTKDIFFKCRKRLNETMEENNVNYGWMDLGGMMSLDYGNCRLAKFVLKQ
jgi:hypothetical protein